MLIGFAEGTDTRKRGAEEEERFDGIMDTRTIICYLLFGER